MATQKRSTQRNSNFPNKSGTRTQHAGGKCSPIHTGGTVFSDGACIELIRDAGTGRLCLLVCDGESRRIASEVEFRGRLYRPADINPSILLAMTFPSKCAHFETTGELFAAVRELFTSRGFPKDVALSTTYFSFAAWFAKFLPAAPCLLIAGPRPEVALLLELLACLVRHPLPLVDVTRSGLCSLPMHLQPTLLIDQQRINRSTWALLGSSNHHTANVLRNDGLVNIFCAKAIFCEDRVYSETLNDGTLQVNIPPSRGRLPILSATDKDEIASVFQSRFLAYRARNIYKVRDSQCDFPEFDSKIRILGRILAAPIVAAPELQADLIPLLRDYQEAIRASKLLDLPCVVIEALLLHCHEKPGEKLYIGQLTKSVNLILKGRGEITEFKPESIGTILRDQGFSPKRDRKGYPILLNDSNRRFIHELAVRFGVAEAQEVTGKCLHCAEIRANNESGRQ